VLFYKTNIKEIFILGMAHIKRATVAAEAKKESENPMKGSLKVIRTQFIVKQ
jgi:hypothetical protein